MSLPAPGTVGLGGTRTISGLTYQVISGANGSLAWGAVTTGTHGVRLQALEESSAEVSKEEDNYWVNSTVGDDTTGDGSEEAPYRTIQKAYDSLPDQCTRQQTIWLAPGDYNELPDGAYAQARPAILSAYGKTTALRSSLVDGNLTGAIIIKSTTGVRGDVRIQSNSGEYGVYVHKGNLGLQDVTIEGSASLGLLVAHRTDTYVQCLNVLVNGEDATTNQRGVYAESGGQVELADACLVTNCNIGVSTLTNGDTVTISGSSQVTYCTTGINVKSGTVYLSMTDTSFARRNMIENCATAINGSNGTIEIRGANSSSLAVVANPIEGINMFVETVYAEVWDTVDLDAGSTLRMDNSGYNQQVTVRDGHLYHRSSNSFLTDTTNNVDVAPLYLPGSTLTLEGTNSIVGANGAFVPFTRTFAPTTDNVQVPVTDDTRVIYMNGNGAARTGCQLNADSVPEGYTVRVEGSTWSIELVNGSEMFLSSPIIIGNSSGMYEGATFTKSRGLWRCTGLGQQIA